VKRRHGCNFEAHTGTTEAT